MPIEQASPKHSNFNLNAQLIDNQGKGFNFPKTLRMCKKLAKNIEKTLTFQCFQNAYPKELENILWKTYGMHLTMDENKEISKYWDGFIDLKGVKPCLEVMSEHTSAILVGLYSFFFSR